MVEYLYGFHDFSNYSSSVWILKAWTVSMEFIDFTTDGFNYSFDNGIMNDPLSSSVLTGPFDQYFIDGIKSVYSPETLSGKYS